VEEGDSLLVLGESERVLSQLKKQLRIGTTETEGEDDEASDEAEGETTD
jgi:hypothetical protein